MYVKLNSILYIGIAESSQAVALTFNFNASNISITRLMRSRRGSLVGVQIVAST